MFDSAPPAIDAASRQSRANWQLSNFSSSDSELAKLLSQAEREGVGNKEFVEVAKEVFELEESRAGDFDLGKVFHRNWLFANRECASLSERPRCSCGRSRRSRIPFLSRNRPDGANQKSTRTTRISRDDGPPSLEVAARVTGVRESIGEAHGRAWFTAEDVGQLSMDPQTRKANRFAQG